MKTTAYFRFPSRTAFYATLDPRAFTCPTCAGAKQVITQYGETTIVDGAEVTSPDTYGTCPTCSGAGTVPSLVGETFWPLPAGVEAVSIIGDKYAGGSYDPDTGEVLTPPTKVPGYHVNALVPATVVDAVLDPDTEEEVTPGSVTAQVPPEWAAYQVFPASPDRVFG